MRSALIPLFLFVSSCCGPGTIPSLPGLDLDFVDECYASEPECCAAHGHVPGKRDTCAISEEPYCIGCDGDPVLCWTVGCESPCDPSMGTCAEDCCIADDGETVACSAL